MTVETNPNYPSDLDSAAPAAGDAKSEGDDHLRNLKRVIKTTLPNVSGAITPTHTELNYVDGVTSAIQTQLDAKAPIASPTLTGTPLAPTAAAGTSTTQIATTAFVAGTAFSSALPAQAGNSGKYVTTDGTTASWAALTAGLIYTARTSNTILGAADFALSTRKFINITSGTFSQTFSPAATIGANQYLYIRNAGTGDITLEPDGAETIDGLTNFVMYPGETRLVGSDGTNLYSIVVSPFTKTFTASGTFAKPPGYNYFGGLLWGGGGSGARNTNTARASGGGGGGCTEFKIPASSFGTTETITIATASAGATGSPGVGVAGGNSTIGSLATGYGGGAGFSDGTASRSGGGGGGTLGAGPAGTTAAVAGGAPAAAVGAANIGFGGGGSPATGSGTDAYYGGGGGASSSAAAAGGASVYGGGGGGGGATGVGGASKFGGAGGAAGGAGNGTDGTAPGGGGGSTDTGTKAGDGARGELRIWGIA